jgi:UDP-N-acetylglucosamine 2-epimerase (non-hydrolysing)
VRRWLVPFGTRPEIVKIAPVVEALRDAGVKVHTLATGQHDDPGLADAFFSDLALEPDRKWCLPTNEAERVGAIMAHAYETLSCGEYGGVLLLGDTHTVPLFSLAARRFAIPVVHLEAGLRSFNAQSVEEGNRRVAGALASLHLAPTELAARMLDAEGISATRVRVVGNPVTDSLRKFGPRRAPVADRAGAVITMHRSTNVDDPDRLRAFVGLIHALGEELGSVRFPVHPRTRDRLVRNGLLHDVATAPGITLEAPLRYGEMLEAIASSRVIVTDSGGLQEEAAWYGVPVVVLRRTTPRREGVLAGSSMLVGSDVPRALDAVRLLTVADELERIAALPCPYGDGHVGPRVASILTHPSTDSLLEVNEPDLAAAPPTLAAGRDS